MLIYIFFLTVIERAFLSLQENPSRVLQTGIVVISLYRFAYRIKILLTGRLGEAISEAIFSFYIIIRCVYAGWPQGSPLQKRYKKCGGRADVGSELSAASGRRSEASEWPRSKFQASAARQRNRIIGPYGCIQGARGNNPPVTALPCRGPLGKGAMGTGVRIATASARTGFAMTWFFARGAVRGRRRGESSPPYGEAASRAVGRADRGVRSYGAIRGVVRDRVGRPQGSPLRKRYKGCSARQAGDRKGRPYGGLHEVRWAGFYPAHGRGKAPLLRTPCYAIPQKKRRPEASLFCCK